MTKLNRYGDKGDIWESKFWKERPILTKMLKDFGTIRNDFLAFLFKDCREGYVEIRHWQHESQNPVKREFIPVGDLGKAQIKLHKGYDCIFGACTRSNGKSGTKADVLAIPFLWVDYDYSPEKFEDVLAEKNIPKPSAVVLTGRGVHAYWVLDKPASRADIPKVESVLKRLAFATGSDMAATEVARCLRLPGTINYKRQWLVLALPLQARLIFNLENFDEHLPPIPEDKEKIKPFIPMLRAAEQGDRHNTMISWMGRLIRSGALPDESIWREIVEWNKTNSPPIPDAELDYQFNDIMKRYADEDQGLKAGDAFTDTRMAMRLAKIYGEDMRFVKEKRVWHCWNGKYWEPDTRDNIIAQSLVRELALYVSDRVSYLVEKDRTEDANKLIGAARATQSQSRRRWIQEAARSELHASVEDFDSNRWQLNCYNGTFNLFLNEFGFRDHKREDMITRMTKVKYDSEAQCPEWMKFLNLITEGDQELIDYLQKVAGYCLTGIADARCFFFFYGPKASGKTTFVQTLLEVVGNDYATSASFDSFAAGNDNKIRNDIASWEKKRIVSSAETEEGRKLAAVQIKILTGLDRFVARHLYQEFREQMATFKIILYGNEPPKAPANDEAFFDRCRVIPFRHTIPEGERLDHYRETLLYPELSGILNWAIAGCRKWQEENGFKVPQVVKDATESYKQEVNVFKKFSDECLEYGPHLKVLATVLYDSFKKFCREELGVPENKIESQTAFGKYMANVLHIDKKPIPQTLYLGVYIKDAWEKLWTK